MRIVAISDCRTTTAEQIEKLCEREKPDLLLYGGDDVARFGPVPDEVYVEAGVRHLRSLVGESPPAAGIFRSDCWGVPGDFGSLASFNFGALLSARIQARAIDRIGPGREPEHGPYLIGGERWTFRVTLRLYEPAIHWSSLACRIPHGIAGVLGNDCLPADAWVLQQPGCHDLHAKPLLLPDLAIIGLAGAAARDGDGRGFLLYDEEAAAAHLARQLSACGDRDVILVSHAPPFEMLDLAVRHGVENIGSHAVRDLVDAGRVALVVCGHVHREGGKTWPATPDCAVVNVACHDDRHAALRYAIIEVEAEHLDITHRELPNEGVHQISGVGAKLAEQLRSAGIREISQLAALGHGEVVSLLGPRRGPQMQAHARSLLRGAPVPVGGCRPSPPEPVIYLDVETSHDAQDDPWLVGLLFPDGRFEQMQALDPEDHPAHLQALDARLRAYPDHTFMQWGSFDRVALGKAYARCGLPVPDWLEKHRWLDACVWLRQHIALPIHSLALDVVCRYFDYAVRHPHLSGMTVGVWYSRYRDEGTDFDVPVVREYNEDDVRALAHVVAAACRLGDHAGWCPDDVGNREL